MAYSDDAVKSKLNALNETQESIVTVAQWIMFHRRHADRTAALWLSRLQDSPTPAKRLTLIYLANEVVQQSRARSKAEFSVAFEPIIADGTALAYKSAGSDVRDKLRRVVEVWRQRNVFDRTIQDTVEQRLKEIDLQRAGKSSGGRLGGSLFGGGGGTVPTELEGVSKSQTAVSKNEAVSKPALEKARTEYAKMMDPDAHVPTPPVHAHKLRELVKNLSVARGALEESIKVRKELLSGLEKLVESNRARLAEEEASIDEISTQYETVEAKKNEIEDGIVRGVAKEASANGTEDAGVNELEPPEVEGFTPPEVPDLVSFPPEANEANEMGESASNYGSDDEAHVEAQFTSTTGAEALREHTPNLNEPAPAFDPPTAYSAEAAANSFLENLSALQHTTAPAPTNGHLGDPRLKKRKMSHRAENDIDEDLFNVPAAGVDEEGVSAMLSAGGNGDSGGGGVNALEAESGEYGW